MVFDEEIFYKNRLKKASMEVRSPLGISKAIKTHIRNRKK